MADEARNTQSTVEVLREVEGTKARLTQSSIEVLRTDASPYNKMQVQHERGIVLSYPKTAFDNNTIQIDHERVMVLSKVKYPSSQITIIT